MKFQNKIYIAQGEKLLPSYQTTVKDLYHADVENLNFANSDKTLKTVNDWVNNVTDGLISTLITKGEVCFGGLLQTIFMKTCSTCKTH